MFQVTYRLTGSDGFSPSCAGEIRVGFAAERDDGLVDVTFFRTGVDDDCPVTPTDITSTVKDVELVDCYADELQQGQCCLRRARPIDPSAESENE